MNFHFKFRVTVRPTTNLRRYFDVQLVMSVELHADISVGTAFSQHQTVGIGHETDIALEVPMRQSGALEFDESGHGFVSDDFANTDVVLY